MNQLSEILKLSVPERILLVEAIWDSIATDSDKKNTYKLNEEQIQLLEEEMVAYSKNPTEGSSWDEIKKKNSKPQMSYNLIIRKRAEKHLTDAYDWYEKQNPTLGSEFLLSIDAGFAAIQTNPFIFQVRHKNIRCALIPRFPYGVFYFIDDKKIIVFAVFHLSRNPGLWGK